MTLNALFKAGDIPCLISDHFVAEGDNRYLTRKSAIMSPQLVVAASDDGWAADIVLQRIHDRFSGAGAAPVTRKALFVDLLGSITDLKEFPCTIIGWLIEGRKDPISFRWNSRFPLSLKSKQSQFVEGRGDRLHNLVIPPFVPITRLDPATNALSYCAEVTAALWMNEVLAGALSKEKCGGGFDIGSYRVDC